MIRRLSDLLRHAVPFRRFVVETSWSKRVTEIEIAKRLTEPKLLRADEEGPFVGTAAGGRLRFRRQVRSQAAHLPMVDAVVVSSHHDGARIVARMRPSPLTMFRMGFGLLITVVFTATIGFAAISTGQLGPLVALLFLPVLAVVLGARYAYESEQLEDELRAIFAGAPALHGHEAEADESSARECDEEIAGAQPAPATSSARTPGTSTK